jgi:SAM-dependent methyltransferase
MSTRGEVWAEGAAYETYVGRWSRLVARAFLAWIAPPRGARWLDLGCGSGALSRTIRACCAPASLIALDRSEGFVRHVRSGEAAATAFMVADALALPLRASVVDVAVSGLVLNFLPAPGVALAQLRRIVRPGGTVGLYVWDYAGRMQLLREFWDAATRLDPAAAALDEGIRFPVCQPGRLQTLFAEAGFDGVEVKPIEVVTRFTDFDDYWRPFLGGQGPAPAYVASLSGRRRAGLRESLRQRLPIAADDSITLVARAWAARGGA